MFYLNQIFDKYQVFLYILYNNIYQFLRINYSSANFFFIPLFVCMGVLTVLTPCFISMFPILVTYTSSNTNQFLNKTLFVLGVMSSVLFTMLISNFINLYSIVYKLPILSSLFLICIALNLMQVFDLLFVPEMLYSCLNRIEHLNNNFQNYIMGLVIGCASVPCNTSIVLLFTFLLKHTSSNVFVLFYLFVYLLGCFLVLITLLNFKINFNNSNFNYLILLWDLIFPLSGSILFIFSLLLFLRKTFL
uniref:Thiol:disulfide interchange protein n=1 Tax=Laurencia catarinensis TaxID=197326 RepID=UPI0028D037DC|nr:Thiol:disulfide interchange protein [Laurencia catarinensis]WMP12398.1 Thiol:disulfide interchange protein [Laurencia catarinensis]